MNRFFFPVRSFVRSFVCYLSLCYRGEMRWLLHRRRTMMTKLGKGDHTALTRELRADGTQEHESECFEHFLSHASKGSNTGETIKLEPSRGSS
jgi:hypothetical protein